MKNIIYIVFVLFFVACDSTVKYEKPENLIPKEQMIDLLYDMNIANATNNVKSIDDEEEKNYMPLVFEKYKIDSAQFAISNTYYISNISEYEEIFIAVEKRTKKLVEKYENPNKNDPEDNIDAATLKELEKTMKSKTQKKQTRTEKAKD